MTNLFSRILFSLKSQWQADTPPIAKSIRNLAGALTVGVPFMAGILTSSGVPVPEWFMNNLWVIISISALITGIAGTKECKEKFDEVK